MVMFIMAIVPAVGFSNTNQLAPHTWYADIDWINDFILVYIIKDNKKQFAFRKHKLQLAFTIPT